MNKSLNKNKKIMDIKESVEDVKEKTSIEKLSFFSKEVPCTYPCEIGDAIHEIIEKLDETLMNHGRSLSIKSIENAIEFIEETGESLNEMLEYEDDPEYIDDFIKEWNLGNTNELSSFLDRWYSEESAKHIAFTCKQNMNKEISRIEELHLAVAITILELGLTKDNFGNVYLAIEEDLKSHPTKILEYMNPIHILIESINGELLFWIDFENDWEVEHGLAWVIKNNIPVYVGAYGSVSQGQLLQWNEIHT